MKEYFENDEENVQMSDLHHLYYMKREKCVDTTGDIMKKQNDAEDQEQPYLIERFDSYCKKVLRFEVMQYYHVKKIAEKHIVLIDDVPQLHIAVPSGQQGRNSRPCRDIIGGHPQNAKFVRKQP